MKAMILAAGIGTRLRPLTDTRPKALVEVAGRTLLEITLTRLRTFGVNEVIINVHHFADMVADYLKSHNNFGMRIEISHEDDLLLDTGGGLKKAGWFFLESAGDSPSEPFLLHNVDVISTIDLHRMVQFHNEHDALATLAVQSRKSSRLLLFDDQLRLCGRHINNQDDLVSNSASDATGANVCHSERSEESASSLNSPLVYPELRGATRLPRAETRGHSFTPSASEGPLPLAFSGIHIISPRLLTMVTEEGVFSIIDAYLRLAAQGEKILAFRADEYYWRDLGRPANLAQAALDLEGGKWRM